MSDYRYGTHFNPPYISLNNYDLDREISVLLSEDFCKLHQVILLDQFLHPKTREPSVITVGMTEPTHIVTLQEIAKLFQCKVLPFQVDSTELAEAITTLYRGV